MSRALIAGITGQDGSYLAEFLQSKGYEVSGIVRERTGEASTRAWSIPASVRTFSGSLADADFLQAVMSESKPDEVYNFAAHTSLAAAARDPVDTGNITGLGPVRILEAIRKSGGRARFCQASSSEMFGNVRESPQEESTPLNPRNPYGASKALAHWTTGWYRDQLGLFACSAILYNHESPRRPLNFVTRKVTSAAARIKRGLEKGLALKSLGDRRDWGFAGDYVRGMWQMLQQSRAEDYLLATGVLHSVRQLCEVAFGHVGLDWRTFVTEEAAATTTENVPLVGNAGKAKRQLGWAPVVGFDDLIRSMVDADLALLAGA